MYANGGRTREPIVEDQLEPPVPRGLMNLGNSCFMNATVQALAHCAPLSHYLRCCTALYRHGLAPQRGGLTAKARLTLAFADTVGSLLEGPSGGGGVVRPAELLEAVLELGPAFRRHEQQDAQELLRLLLDVLHEQMQRPLAGPELADRRERVARQWRAATSEEYTDPDEAAWERETKTWREQQAKGLYSRPPRKPAARTTSAVAHLFEGELLSSVECCACKHISYTRECCLDLSLPLPGGPAPKGGAPRHALNGAASPDGGGGEAPPPKAARAGLGGSLLNRSASIFGALNPLRHSGGERAAKQPALQDCLGAFFATEHLSGDEQYKCEKCKSLQNCHKSLRLLHLPAVLAFQLKRFRNVGGVGRKAADPITFPMTQLDMRPYFAAQPSEAASYDLSAVIVHHGASLSSGHYTAYVKGVDAQRRTQWFLKDDAHATPVTAEEVARAEAYLLLYTRAASREHLDVCSATVQAALARADAGAHAGLNGVAGGAGGEPVLLSRGWLARLLSSEQPGAPSLDDVLCSHGRVDPRAGRRRGGASADGAVAQAAACCVLVPPRTWGDLQQRFHTGGGVRAAAVSEGALRACPECAAEEERSQLELQRERDEITRLDSTSVQPGDAWFVIDSQWLTHWREYAITHLRSEPPGPVSNWRLLEKGAPKHGLLRVKDYRGVNGQVWLVFQRRYGGGPPICRSEINLYSPKLAPPPGIPVDGPAV